MNDFNTKALALADAYAEARDTANTALQEVWRTPAYKKARLNEVDAARAALADHLESGADVQRELEELRFEANRSDRCAIMYSDVIANHCIAMQSALIEWYGTGTADSGMQWIENTLSGPGLLPDMKEASALGGAQGWFDAKMAEHDAHREAHPLPDKLSAPDAARTAASNAGREKL